jgi:hypothetical protein
MQSLMGANRAGSSVDAPVAYAACVWRACERRICARARRAWRRLRAALHAACPIAMKSFRTGDWKHWLQQDYKVSPDGSAAPRCTQQRPVRKEKSRRLQLLERDGMITDLSSAMKNRCML